MVSICEATDQNILAPVGLKIAFLLWLQDCMLEATGCWLRRSKALVILIKAFMVGVVGYIEFLLTFHIILLWYNDTISHVVNDS